MKSKTPHSGTKMAKAPAHKLIKEVAEAMAEVLSRDYEELVNFVQASLEEQYEGPGGFENFLEDWEEYVKK